MIDRDMLEGYRDGLDGKGPADPRYRSSFEYLISNRRGEADLRLFRDHPSLVQAIREAVEEALRKEPRT